MKKPCDVFIESGTMGNKTFSKYLEELNKYDKPFVWHYEDQDIKYYDKRKKLKKILILIIIIETFIYLVLSQIIIFKNSNTIKANEKLIKELEENRNTLISENSYLKIQNMNLWEYYYTNNSK